MKSESMAVADEGKRGFFLGFGAFASSISVALTAFCCITPVALGAFGLGLAGIGARLEPYRPYLMTATFLFLAMAFYQAYRPQKVACESDKVCATPRGRRALRVTLWFVASCALLFAVLPYLVSYYVYLTL